MNTTTGTTTYRTPPDLIEVLRAVEIAQRRTIDMVALPPGLMKEVNSTASEIEQRMAQAGPSLFGLKVITSNLLNNMPGRVHKKRKWMSWAYHRRIQKKWNKRFGVGPVALLMNSDVFLRPIDSRRVQK